MKKEDFIQKIHKVKSMLWKNKKATIYILSGIICVAAITIVIAVSFNTPTTPVKTAEAQTNNIADILRNDTSTKQSQSEVESTSSHNDKKLNASDSENTQKETVSESPSGNQPSKQSDTGKNDYGRFDFSKGGK